MDPLGSLQLCVYYVKQMNAFPLLTTKIMSALTGAGIINGALCAIVQAHRVLRTGLSPLNAGPDENLQINFLLQKFLFFSPAAEAGNRCLTRIFHWQRWSRALDLV